MSDWEEEANVELSISTIKDEGCSSSSFKNLTVNTEIKEEDNFIICEGCGRKTNSSYTNLKCFGDHLEYCCGFTEKEMEYLKKHNIENIKSWMKNEKNIGNINGQFQEFYRIYKNGNHKERENLKNFVPQITYYFLKYILENNK